MKLTGFYTLFFWVIWVLIIPLTLKVIPAGSELIAMVIYSFIGLGLYFSIPLVLDACLAKRDEKRYKDQKEKVKTKEQFLKEQYLKKKYRYIKLNAKENIINSDIEVKDKISLLQTFHGYSPEDALQLIEKSLNK